MSDIKFSIIVPAFKKQFLKECIDSILAQSYDNFEVIIINDHSPQDLDVIINNYKDERIRYYKNEKGFGALDVVNNWNKGLGYATGQYTICMGDDDMLHPECLSRYVELIKKYPKLNIYHAWALIIDEDSNTVGIQDARPERESAYSMIWHLWNGRRQFIGDWLIKTDFLREMGGYYYQPYAWTSDHITAFKAAADGGVANMQDIGFMYRENRQSITTNTSNTKEKISAMLSAKAWYNEFLKKVPDDNDIDRIYYKLILKKLDFHINRRIAYDLSERLRKKPFDIFYWILNKNKYGLNMHTIIMACAFALKKLIR